MTSWSRRTDPVRFPRRGHPGAFCLVAACLAGLAACSTNEVGSVTPPADGPAAVASVTVSPSADTLLVGDSQQLAVVVKDARGRALTGRPVSWVSLDPAAASVTSAGVVSGRAQGSARIVASSEGQSGSALITVWPIQRDPAECDSPKPAWLWCDDFEKDRIGQYFEYGSDGGNFVRAPGVGYGGSVGMRARFASAGHVNAGFLHLAFGKVPSPYFRTVDAGVARYREIYWRHLIKYAQGWIGGGGAKVSRAQSIVTRQFAQAMMAHVWSGSSPDEHPNELGLAPASGTDVSGILRTRSYNDFPNFRWLGVVWSRTSIFAPAGVGKWYCIEAHAKLNDPGRANGVFELWINGQPEAQITQINWLGSFSEYGINTVYLENYWNDGAPQPEERYFDNFVVSTQRIGC